MAYDEQLEGARRKVIDTVREQQGERMAKAVQSSMEIEDTLTDTLRKMVEKILQPASENKEALALAKLAVAEALSTIYAEAAVKAFDASRELHGMEQDERQLLSLAIRSVVGNLQVAAMNQQINEGGIEDMIVSARA